MPLYHSKVRPEILVLVVLFGHKVTVELGHIFVAPIGEEVVLLINKVGHIGADLHALLMLTVIGAVQPDASVTTAVIGPVKELRIVNTPVVLAAPTFTPLSLS